MSDRSAIRTYLLSEVEQLAAFDFVAAMPSGMHLFMVEITRNPQDELEVRVPGRPPVVPPLGEEVRSALEERDLRCENAEDPTRPWTRVMQDAEGAVDLLLEILGKVFATPDEVKLDVAHGNHRAEHEARSRSSTTVRARLEKVLPRDPRGSRARAGRRRRLHPPARRRARDRRAARAVTGDGGTS